MKLSILGLFLASLVACSKNGPIINECDNVTFYSDKYTLDSVFLKTDLMMAENKVCGIDLQRCIAANLAPPFHPCGFNMMEIHRYKIGNKNSQPKIFK